MNTMKLNDVGGSGRGVGAWGRREEHIYSLVRRWSESVIGSQGGRMCPALCLLLPNTYTYAMLLSDRGLLAATRRVKSAKI